MEMMGDFEPVMSLIDAYNLLQSDRVNDKEQLVDAILCLYNMDFTEEQAQLLRSSRMLANIPADGKVEYLVKTLHETDVDVLRRNIENDIHKISMTPNMSDENFANNSSGVAIKYKLLSFEQNIKNKERYMEKGLMERFELYNNFLATGAKMETVPLEEVDAIFKRNLPSNDYETSQMINNLADFVDKETLISQLSFIKDASEIVALKEKEKKEDMENQPIFKLNEIDNINDKENDNLEEKE
jgi:phage portal protein, SPP1 gp6-like